VRDRGRRRFVPLTDPDEAEAGYPEYIQPADHRSPAPGEQLDNREVVEHVLAPLPDAQREALRRRHQHGWKLKAIAARLHVHKKRMRAILVAAACAARRACAAV
jgi:DNA-directed RNA polymerase specialized sigma24 family protein